MYIEQNINPKGVASESSFQNYTFLIARNVSSVITDTFG